MEMATGQKTEFRFRNDKFNRLQNLISVVCLFVRKKTFPPLRKTTRPKKRRLFDLHHSTCRLYHDEDNSKRRFLVAPNFINIADEDDEKSRFLVALDNVDTVKAFFIHFLRVVRRLKRLLKHQRLESAF